MSLAEQSRSAFRRADATPDQAEKDRLLREAQRLAGHDALAAAYSHLQKAVGLIAVTLPPVVAIGYWWTDRSMKGSISAYYYTHMGNWFVGSLFALGVFFLSYNYRPLAKYRVDNALSNVATVMALGVALFPTASDVGTASGGAKVVSTAHLIFAGCLFVLLAIFSLFLFTQTGGQPVTAQKRARNRVYRICGGVIVAAIAAIVVAEIVKPPRSWHSLFWLESVAVVAFGISWLVKGEFLGWFADK